MVDVNKLVELGFSPNEAQHLGNEWAASLSATGNASQANGYSITAQFSEFSTVAAAANSATLPVIDLAERSVYYVYNSDSADNLNLYPGSGDKINSGAADAGVVVTPGMGAILRIVASDRWLCSWIPNGGDLYVADDLTVNSTLTVTSKSNLSGDVDVSGDLVFDASGGGLPYGYMYKVDEAGDQISLDADTWAQIDGWDGSKTNNVTYQNDKEFLITVAGFYLVNWSCSYYAAAAKTFEIGPGVDTGSGIDITLGKAQSNLQGATPDWMHLSGTSILDLAVDDVVGLLARNRTDGNDIYIEEAHMTILQVGGT